MLNFIYPISYLLCLTGLILWFYFKENGAMSRRMSTLFLISFLVYLFALAFSESTLSYKLLILFRDLIILAIVSQLFNYIRNNSLLVLMAAVGVYGLIQFVGFNMLFDTFPQVTISQVENDDKFDLLVETQDGKVPASYQRLIEKYNLDTRTAFQPADPDLSRLDEFIAIGIPDSEERHLIDIIRKLRSLDGTQHVEYNEVITL